ncbi:hypothetical protein TNCV_4282991 [Trichonephila clavipes]|nr:hypothetical protein TNCV_4282991 [Trichonephila clavipes]
MFLTSRAKSNNDGYRRSDLVLLKHGQVSGPPPSLNFLTPPRGGLLTSTDFQWTRAPPRRLFHSVPADSTEA